ncbi:MAG: pyruvate ferredoxin oxidoreductase alpha subunit, partial [uncultured bacterium]
YPITPSSEIMTEAAEYASEHTDFKFMQMEDEIASAMAVIGASLAGAKAFTATSGPGFSLMQESIGLAYMTSTPCVFIDVQRVGPSTGMPTYPAQGDVFAAGHGTHGDYNAIVLAPNSVGECYQLTACAFDMAEEAETPVIVLSDGYVGHLSEIIDLEKIKISISAKRRRKPIGFGTRHFTGLLSENGVPKTSDSKVYNEWYYAKKKTVLDVALKQNLYEYIENKKSDTLLISFGITSRVCMDLKSKFGYFRPIRLLPILEKELREVSKNYKKIIVVEANDGQYASLVEQALMRKVGKIALLGGEINLENIKRQMPRL